LREEANSRILRVLPREKAFYFFTSIGNYTGEGASSLKEFMEKLPSLDVKSVEFHVFRGDFEKWVTEVLGDNRLAEEIVTLRKSGLRGEQLRSQLCAMVSRRHQQLVRPVGLLR
jgi:hypothetical protein